MFFILDPNASCKAAPTLVPKQSKAHFRSTIDLRPVYSSTRKIAGPMQHIDSEMHGFKGQK